MTTASRRPRAARAITRNRRADGLLIAALIVIAIVTALEVIAYFSPPTQVDSTFEIPALWTLNLILLAVALGGVGLLKFGGLGFL